MNYINTPTMLEGYPLTMSEIIKIKTVSDIDILDLESFEDAYNMVFLFEQKYGLSSRFSTHKRAEFLWWFIFSDSETSTPWQG